ncbi:MAG: CHASE domain-containing protein [Candidatus Saccharibacteria bacterium]
MGISNLPGFKYLAKNNSYAYLIVVAFIFIVGTVASIINWHATESRTSNALVAKYQQELNESKLIINQSLTQYTLLLDDGTSLLAVNGNNVTESQWLTFFQSYNLPVNYPGVDAVSFSQYVPASDLSDYMANLQSQGITNFNLTPAGSRSAYAPVTYVGYVSSTSLNAMGYDQLTSPVRATAINKALDSGQVTMSGLVNLVAVNKNKPAFLIYKPVYGGPSNTQAQRQASIFGFVFTAVNANEFFTALLSHYLSPGIAISVYDGSVSPSNVLYQTPNYANNVSHIASPINSTLNVTFGGRTWVIKVVTAKSLVQASSSNNSTNDLVFGIAISFAVALILWYFTYYRERKSYWEKQREIQSAKDELLSLASHQLRTPATVVKQYLGILLQNYSGAITHQQRKIIKTAYESNERQLEIANQFLDAAKLGSGRIKLSKKAVVLNDIIKDVVDEQQKIANVQKQRVIYNNPKRPIGMKADPKYLPMVVENLISNAIKYSKKRAAINVRLRKLSNEVQIKVIDQGVGIPEDELREIFEKFSHASNEANADGNGTGIGLYLAKQIINLHGGNITVKSTVGKGSEFTVHLPL